jgi:hypothetical protein
MRSAAHVRHERRGRGLAVTCATASSPLHDTLHHIWRNKRMCLPSHLISSLLMCVYVKAGSGTASVDPSHVLLAAGDHFLFFPSVRSFCSLHFAQTMPKSLQICMPRNCKKWKLLEAYAVWQGH